MLLCKNMLNLVVHLVGVLLTPCPFWLRGRTLRRSVNCWNSVAVAVLSSRTSPSRNKDPVRAAFRAEDCLQVPHRTSCISSTALSHVRLKLLSTDSRQGLTTKRTESRGRCSLLGRIKASSSFCLCLLLSLLLNEPVSHSCSMAGPGIGAAFMAALADAGLDLKTKQAAHTQ